MEYRREIDGLRAIAVLPVILFHAGFRIFGGGFVGVDVFFVISGYLITTIILADLEQRKFSVVNFYERRIRRIFPALFLVVLFCIPIAWSWLLPSEMKGFSASVAAVFIFASNILFWRESGYFDTAAEVKPLLHTWSLAVEEQYYLLFPVLLMLLWKVGKRWIPIALGLAFFVSLAVAQRTAHENPVAAFYLLPTRAWELLIGAFAALYLSQAKGKYLNRWVKELAGWSGIVLILYAVVTFNKATPFPGFYALVPTLGALLIILFATQQTTVGKFIGNRWFVGVGMISYSAYLWHQPLFAFARQSGWSEPGDKMFLLLSITSLVLAYLSWRYVEVTFRNKLLLSRSQLFLFASLGTAVMLAFGVVGHWKDGYKNRLPKNIIWESLGSKLKAQGDVCEPKPVKDYSGVSVCKFGSTNGRKTVILYGDSHASAISGYIHTQFLQNSIEGIKAKIDGCGVIPSVVDTRAPIDKNKDCSKKFSSLISFIRSKKADLIVSARWSFRLYPIPDYIVDMPYRNSEGGVETENYREFAVLDKGKLDLGKEAKTVALKGLVEGLLNTNQRVFLIYPVPEIGWNIAKKNWEFYKESRSLLDQISISTSDFQSRNRLVISIFDSFVDKNNFHPVRPSDVFCNSFIQNRCVAQYNTLPFYYDDDHLSEAGAKLVVDSFFGKVISN